MLHLDVRCDQGSNIKSKCTHVACMLVVPKVKLIRRSGVEVFSVYFTFPMTVESAITKMTLVVELGSSRGS